ncbi:class I adenylate cyclase [endosymbiont of Riftia pachyptila]|uniref:Adenylate cyclase n=1 Tax=endosymbiont of Riftia pachyptila (vent Ph05) TaxID=1048808 RepID=G2D906_9GAMM|nr:class I adenylate cyclase [endosymbiont of Riftia pachyptila]EGV52873.1 adenylate cyclase [endosymbiont of Riftia pachyptila (vent Ph05)]
MSCHSTTAPQKAGTLSWMLFRGKVEQADQQQPIKVTLNLVEMLLWCLLNQVWGSATLTHLFPSHGPIKRHELNAIFYDLQHLFPQHKSAHVTIDQLAGPAYPTLIALFVNLGQDPMQHLSAEGKQLTSDRYDPLSYGSARANLLINMEELVVTSWGERLVLHREGPEGLLDSLCQLLTMQQQPSQMPALAHIEAFSHAASKGPQVAQRLAGLYRHILGYFNQQPGHGGRYAFRISEAFYLIQQKEQGFQWRNLDSFEHFLQALETPQHVFQPLQIDPRILRQTPYPALYRHNKPDLIQLFFHVQRESVQIYLLDEQGALFRQSMLMDSPRFMMLQQRRFLNSLQQLRLMLPGGAGNLLAETEFYELKQAPSGDWSIERRRVPLNGPDDYMELTLVTDSLASDAMPVALVCGDREFSRLEYGEMIYSATAGFLQGLRAGNKRYPIYLTSLRISSMRQDEAPATVTLLKLKRAIEQKLNHALEELG